MNELDTIEIRSRLLEMLKELDKFCRENNIQYSLGEGTLIGAIRHKGFIPWDDDVDVIMSRENYDKFINLYHSNRFYVLSLDNCVDWHMLFSRLVDRDSIAVFRQPFDVVNYHHGLWIDVLPIDNAPSSLEALYKMVRRARTYFNMETYRNFFPSKSRLKNVAKRVASIVLGIVPSNFFARKAEKVLKEYRHIKTNKKGFFSCIWHDPYVFSSSVFDSYCDAPFEGNSFRIVTGYDEYLRVQYGNYMVPPPEKERQSDKHQYSVFLKEK